MQVVQGTANLVPRTTAGPPGKFNGIIPQPFHVCSESFTTVTLIVFS